MSDIKTKRVLWWGRSDINYSRNRIIRQLFNELGWEIIDFSPKLSSFAYLQALFSQVPKTELVWVPCFRQRDLAQASRWARRFNIPLYFDPLISAYDKQVFEKEKFSSHSKQAKKLLTWEQKLFALADRVIADTQEHASFFINTLKVDNNKVTVIPVGAEESIFYPKAHKQNAPLKVLFFGSFIRLQGVEVIAQAIEQYQGPEIEWSFVGKGPFLDTVKQKLASLENVFFTDWLSYNELSKKIVSSDLCLGVFGQTEKAGRVIPNKVYQSLACGCPVITRQSKAYPEELKNTSSGIIFVPEGNAKTLAQTITTLANDKSKLFKYREQAFASYQNFFSNQQLKLSLEKALS